MGRTFVASPSMTMITWAVLAAEIVDKYTWSDPARKAEANRVNRRRAEQAGGSRGPKFMHADGLPGWKNMSRAAY